MATLNVLIDRPPREVWEVLRDGESYARWVVGTRTILGVDESWPEVGSKIHFRVGAKRLNFDDFTVVRRHTEDQLELQIYARRLGSARVSITVRKWGEDQSLVIIDEHPLTGPAARFHNFVVESALTRRNRRMARVLKSVVEQDHPQ